MATKTKETQRVKNIRDFVLDGVTEHPRDIVRVTANEFELSRQSASNHLRELIKQGLLVGSGNTRGRVYKLKAIADHDFPLEVGDGLEEDVEWRQKIVPLLAPLSGQREALDRTKVSDNVQEICHYGFTEMVNNVIDHSECTISRVRIRRTARDIRLDVFDNGIGIFQKLQDAFQLEDPRHALLELSKGKLTSDPANHTGEGIFFTSRMFKEFSISSGTLIFRRFNKEDWLVEVANRSSPLSGTLVTMIIEPRSEETVNGVFTKFSDDEFRFSRTHVPIELAVYEGEKLLSRSQARRILARFDRFTEVMLDFRGVDEIGQAFADEIFRVFRREHPDIDVRWVFTTPEIDQMIARVTGDSGKAA